jgi:hypothetical protein
MMLLLNRRACILATNRVNRITVTTVKLWQSQRAVMELHRVLSRWDGVDRKRDNNDCPDLFRLFFVFVLKTVIILQF